MPEYFCIRTCENEALISTDCCHNNKNYIRF